MGFTTTTGAATGDEDNPAKVARLRRVTNGLRLVLAGMLIQVAVIVAAPVFLFVQFALAAILPWLQLASVLPLALQAAGHWFCLSVPRGVQTGRRRGSARSIVLFTLFFDAIALIVIAWNRASEFGLLGKPAWLPNPGFGLLIPLVFLQFVIALSRYVQRLDLASWGRAIVVSFVVLAILALASAFAIIVMAVQGPGPALMGAMGGVLAAAVTALVISILYLAYIILLFRLIPAVRDYAEELSRPDDGTSGEAAEAEPPLAIDPTVLWGNSLKQLVERVDRQALVIQVLRVCPITRVSPQVGNGIQVCLRPGAGG
jgi:hypothetical protein